MFQPDKPPQKRVGRGYVPQGPTMYHDYHVTLSNVALKGFKNPSYWGRIFGNSMAKLGQRCNWIQFVDLQTGSARFLYSRFSSK